LIWEHHCGYGHHRKFSLNYKAFCRISINPQSTKQRMIKENSDSAKNGTQKVSITDHNRRQKKLRKMKNNKLRYIDSREILRGLK
jgi:hypothetical protein